MGKKDLYTDSYMTNPLRAAELLNVCLYGGKKLVDPHMLTRLRGGYPSVWGGAGEKMRDILLEHRMPRIRYGIELESEIDLGMPERVMVYDAGEYENQIRERHRKHCKNKEYGSYIEKKSRMKRKDQLIPVNTLVLYLGEGSWEGPRRLSEMMKQSEKPGRQGDIPLQDYQIRVVEADSVNPEDYQTDLKEFFRALQNRNHKEKLKELFETEEFQNLSQDAELAIAANLNLKEMIVKMEKEEVSMCRAFQELMDEQEEKGIEKGIEKGKLEMLQSLIADQLIDAQCAAKQMKVSTEELEGLFAGLQEI